MNKLRLLPALILILAASVAAQTTEFTYQGNLRDASGPVNGNYDIEFDFYSALTGGQFLLTIIKVDVPVTNGVFTTTVNAPQVFTGPPRYIELSFKPSGTQSWTTLAPRQLVTRTPYAIQSLNTSSLGGIAASGFIQNSTTVQPQANFNIGGFGEIQGSLEVHGSLLAGNFSTSSINLPGSMVVSSGGNVTVTTGPAKGKLDQGSVTFSDIGQTNLSSGITTESSNEVINIGANTGREGPYLQSRNGYYFRVDVRPAFGGFHFVKKLSGPGSEADVATIDAAGNFGIGAPAPAERLHVSGTGVIRARINSNDNAGLGLTLNNQPGWSLATVSGGQFQIYNDSIAANAVWIDKPTNNVGIGTNAPAAKLDVAGTIRAGTIGLGGSTAVCFNASLVLSTCSSSSRYKTNFANFRSGLDVIRQLRPVSFDWRDGGMHDVGLVAEDVASIEPLLTTKNAAGETEGVKYDRVGVVLINAVKEQQAEIESLRRQLSELKAIVCAANKKGCKPEEK